MKENERKEALFFGIQRKQRVFPVANVLEKWYDIRVLLRDGM